MSVIIRIPVAKHIRHYLEVQNGPVIYVSGRNYASTLIRSMLKKFDKNDPSKVRPSQKMNLGATYDINLGKNGLQLLGGYLSDENIKKFNIVIDAIIRQEMYRWCHHPNATDHIIDFNIRRFIDFYGFAEDDLPFENLKRWYFRERKRLTNRLRGTITGEVQSIINFSGITTGANVQ